MELLVIGKKKIVQMSRPAACGLSLALTPMLAAFGSNPNTVVHAPSHAANPVLLSVFTALNYASGIAIVGAIIFGLIWLFQKKGLVDELPTQTVPAAEAEAVGTNETKTEA